MGTGFQKSIFWALVQFYIISYQFSYQFNRWSTTSRWFDLTGFWITGKPGGCPYHLLSVPVGINFFVRLSWWHRLLRCGQLIIVQALFGASGVRLKKSESILDDLFKICRFSKTGSFCPKSSMTPLKLNHWKHCWSRKSLGLLKVISYHFSTSLQEVGFLEHILVLPEKYDMQATSFP